MASLRQVGVALMLVAAVALGAHAAQNIYGWSCCCDGNDGAQWWAFSMNQSTCATTAYNRMIATNKSFTCYGNGTAGDNNQIFITAANGTFSVIANGEPGVCTGDGFNCGSWSITRSFFPTYDWAIRNNDLTGTQMMIEYVACEVLQNEFGSDGK